MRTPKERLEYAVNNILQSIRKLAKVDAKLKHHEEVKVNIAIAFELEKALRIIREKNQPFKFLDR